MKISTASLLAMAAVATLPDIYLESEEFYVRRSPPPPQPSQTERFLRANPVTEPFNHVETKGRGKRTRRERRAR